MRRKTFGEHPSPILFDIKAPGRFGTRMCYFKLLSYLFASKYLPYLPTEEELAAEIEREKLFFKQQRGL